MKSSNSFRSGNSSISIVLIEYKMDYVFSFYSYFTFWMIRKRLEKQRYIFENGNALYLVTIDSFKGIIVDYSQNTAKDSFWQNGRKESFFSFTHCCFRLQRRYAQEIGQHSWPEVCASFSLKLLQIHTFVIENLYWLAIYNLR